MRRLPGWPLAALLLLGWSAQGSAQVAGARGLTVGGALGSELLYLASNVRGGFDGADTVLRITPSLRADSRSDRLQGTLAYSAQINQHSQPYEGDRVDHQLATAWSLAAVERFAYVDFDATVSQQTANAYGTLSAAGSPGANDNRITVATASVSPYLRGVLASAISYELRHSAQATNGRRSIEADSDSQLTSLQLSSVAPGTMLGWGLQASSQTVDFRAGRETRSDRALASLSLTPDPDLTLVVRGGQERTNVADTVQTRYDNWGAGFTWRPSPRTRAQLDLDERYFGRAYRALLEHRLSRSTLRLSSSRESTSGSAPGTSSATLYQLLNTELASTEPDPVRREQLVLERLRAANADPNTRVSFGFISSAVNLVEATQLAFNYAGPRLSFGLQAYDTRSRVIDAAALATAPAPVHQRGADLSLGYRLDRLTSLTLNLSSQETLDTPTLDGGVLGSFSWTLTHQLGSRTSLGLSGRYSEQRGGTTPYREGQLQASLSVRF